MHKPVGIDVVQVVTQSGRRIRCLRPPPPHPLVQKCCRPKMATQFSLHPSSKNLLTLQFIAEHFSMTLKNYVKSLIGQKSATALKRYSIHARYLVNRLVVSRLHQAMLNPLNRARYAKRPNRYLEIGPGYEVIDGFETINVVSGRNVTYIGNAAKRMPFGDNTFDVVYASHVIEHLPWYQVKLAVREWVRILKPGGALEIWTPHGLRIAKAFVDAEERGIQDFHNDGWWPLTKSTIHVSGHLVASFRTAMAQVTTIQIGINPYFRRAI